MIEIAAPNAPDVVTVTTAARDAFIVTLSDALRPLSDPVAVQDAAVHVLGAHLGASRVFYAFIEPAGETAIIRSDYANGVPSAAGRHSLMAFAPGFVTQWRQGRTTRTADVTSDPRFTEAQRAAYASVSTRATVAVPLVKAGRFVALLGVNQSIPRSWTDEEVALTEETAERTWDAVERARAEEALRDSEAKYRSLFNSIDEGFCIIEVLFDENDTAVDYRFVEVNPTFEKQTGLRDALGKRMRELAPDHEAHWFEIYGRIARTGQPERFQNRASALHRYYDVYAFPVEDPSLHRVAILFTDITARKRSDDALRESEVRHAYLLRLDVALRNLADPQEIQAAALRVLGEQLGVNRAIYSDVSEERDEYVITRNYLNGLPPLLGRFRLSEIHRRAQLSGSGQVVVVNDANTDPRVSEAERATYASLDTAAAIGVLLIKDSRWVAELRVQHKTSRDWTAAEISLVRETAERAWPSVERARAEHARQASEQREREIRERDTLRRMLVAAEEEERRRLSRDLHDEVGQRLTALGLGLRALADDAPAGAQLRRRCGELSELTALLGRELHALALRIRPVALDDFGLEAAVEGFADEWSKRLNIATKLDIDLGATRLPPTIETGIYRIVQEALTNIARHSGAGRASILVQRRGGQVSVVIEDDGHGIDEQKSARPGGLGLPGIRERVALLDGELTIESSSAGMSLFILMPIRQSTAAAL